MFFTSNLKKLCFYRCLKKVYFALFSVILYGLVVRGSRLQTRIDLTGYFLTKKGQLESTIKSGQMSIVKVYLKL